MSSPDEFLELAKPVLQPLSAEKRSSIEAMLSEEADKELISQAKPKQNPISPSKRSTIERDLTNAAELELVDGSQASHQRTFSGLKVLAAAASAAAIVLLLISIGTGQSNEFRPMSSELVEPTDELLGDPDIPNGEPDPVTLGTVAQRPNSVPEEHISGSIVLSNGCLQLVQADTTTRLVVIWPPGTSWNQASKSVLLASGSVIPLQAEVTGLGTIADVRELTTLTDTGVAEEVAACDIAKSVIVSQIDNGSGG